MAELQASVSKPRAGLRVGVTGHRTGEKLPAEVQPAVRATVDRLFREISHGLEATASASAWAFSSERAQLVVVSALAEGADRIVAEAGLAAGAVLDVVLPAPRAAYERDFAAESSKVEFGGLLARARSVFELENADGEIGAKRGYQAAGLMMLANADLLIAVWDEGEAAGIGGTAEIIEEAYAEGAPVILINPATPQVAELLWSGAMELAPAKVRLEEAVRSDAFAAMASLVTALVAPDPGETSELRLSEFYAERPGPAHGWPIYSILLAFLAVRPLQWTDFRPSDEDAFAPGPWRRWFPEPYGPLTSAVCTTLLPAITLPDRLAVRYAEHYRSAFVFNFFTSAVVVMVALTGLLIELEPIHRMVGGEFGAMRAKAILVAIEIVLLSAILFVWRQGARRGWHRRWLDYRRMAEWLRYLRVLSLVGARAPLLRPRAVHAPEPTRARARRLLDRLVIWPQGQARPENKPERGDWVGWYLRAMGRQLPLPSLAVDSAYVRRVRAVMVRFELNGQIGYHRRNSRRMAEAAHRLHAIGRFLFVAPMLIGLYFLWGYYRYATSPKHAARWAVDYRQIFTALTAALPAFGAALNAIRVQADFETVAARSDEAAVRLTAIRAAMLRDPPQFALLSDRIQRAVAVMGAEHSEWRTLFGTRPLSLPA